MASGEQSTRNAPAFDPLAPSDAEADDMLAGYLDGHAGRPPSRETIAYAWGRGSAARDRGDEPDAERREVERRMWERTNGKR